MTGRHLVSVALALAIGIGLLGSTSEAQTRIRYAHVGSEGDIQHWFAEELAKRINAETQGRVVVQVGVAGLGHDLAVGIMAAGGADMVRALELAAVGAIVRVPGNQRIMRTAHVAAGPGDSVLRDGHGTTFVATVRGGRGEEGAGPRMFRIEPAGYGTNPRAARAKRPRPLGSGAKACAPSGIVPARQHRRKPGKGALTVRIPRPRRHAFAPV